MAKSSSISKVFDCPREPYFDSNRHWIHFFVDSKKKKNNTPAIESNRYLLFVYVANTTTCVRGDRRPIVLYYDASTARWSTMTNVLLSRLEIGRGSSDRRGTSDRGGITSGQVTIFPFAHLVPKTVAISSAPGDRTRRDWLNERPRRHVPQSVFYKTMVIIISGKPNRPRADDVAGL